MPRYIDVTEYIKKLLEEKEQCMANGHGDGGINAIIARLERVPTADVAPVVHGEWIEEGRCSCCGFSFYDVMDADSDFASGFLLSDMICCPNCGAKMDGGRGNG